MKHSLFIVLLLFFIPVHSQTINAVSPYNKMSLGFSGGHYGKDVGVMLSLTTSAFNNNRHALRLSAGIRWSELYYAATNTNATYTSIQLGMVYLISQHQKARVYGETGFNLIFPNAAFSINKDVPGFYTAAGLECYLLAKADTGLVYFIELGVTLNPARADKLENQPRYGYGFTPVTGFRFHF